MPALKLTRNQFASFLKDAEQIKQFEKLFEIGNGSVVVDTGTLDDGDYIYWDAGLQAWVTAQPDAMTRVNDANVTLTLGGSPGNSLFSPVSLALGWQGTLSIARGGTDATNAADAVFNLGAVPTARTLTAGTGLTGGGDLSANRAFAITNTTVAAGSYGSGTQVGTFTVNAQGQLTAAANVAITAAGIGAVPTARTLIAGAGLTGGGDLSADRTFDVGAGTGITVNANDVAISNTTVGAGSYGSATSIPSFTVNAQGQLTAASGNSIPVLASGTYTPTLTNVANITSSATTLFMYSRVGDIVTVSGQVSVTPTVGATSTSLGITLPIASAFTDSADARGNAAAPGIQQSGAIEADTVNDRAQLRYISVGTAAAGMFITFQYRLI